MKTIEIFLKSHKIIKVIVSNETDINLAKIKNYDVMNIHGAKNRSIDTAMIQVIDIIKQDDNDFCKDMSEIAFANINEQPQYADKNLNGVYQVEGNPDLIIHRPDKSRYTYIGDNTSDETKDKITQMQGTRSYLVERNLKKQMEQFQPNVPFIKT